MFSGKKVTDPVLVMPKTSQEHTCTWVWDPIGKSRKQPFPKTEHSVKSKLTQSVRRKISHLDDKYVEEESEPGEWMIQKKAMERKTRSRNCNGYDRHEALSRFTRTASPKQVDFLPNFQLREVNNDGTYTDSIANPTATAYSKFGLTSKDLDVNRIKGIHAGDSSGNRVDYSSMQRVPSALTSSSVGVAGGYSQHLFEAADDKTFKPSTVGGRREHDGILTNGKCKTRLLKKNLTDLPQEDEILAKLKEKIRQQRLNHSLSESSRDEMLVTAVTASRDSTSESSLNCHSNVVHVTSIKQRIEATENYPKSRKVASGPPVPQYKGFAVVDKRMFPAYHTVSRSAAKKSAKKTARDKDKKCEEMEEVEKVKKPKRVVAAEKKSSKQGARDIITTSSWRVGQELVRQKLGPAKTKSRRSQAIKKDLDKEEKENGEDAQTESAGFGFSPGEIKNISEESRKVLQDMQLQEEEQADHEKKSEEYKKQEKKRLSVKRKAPRQSETEKLQPCHKHRSDNSDQIKKYIAKQKAERHRRQREAKQAQQIADQKRREQLDLLTKRSRTVPQRQLPKKMSRHNTVSEEPSKKNISQGLKDDHAVPSIGSQYHRLEEESFQQMDVEDESSTLTGDTEDDLTPVPTPREEKVEERQMKNELLTKKVTVQGKKLDIDVDGVLSAFSKYKQSLQRDPTTSASSQTTATADLKAIYEASASLRSRLLADRLQKSSASAGVQVDRITGIQTPSFNEFSGSLPGTTDWKVKFMENNPLDKHVTMRTAFHNNTSSNLALNPNRRSSLEKPEESSLSETSTFDDITVTEASESESDNSRPAKVAKQTKDRKVSGIRRHQTAACVFKPSPVPAFDKPTADHYSVLNVFNRKMKQLGKENVQIKSSSSTESERKSVTSSSPHFESKEPVTSTVTTNLTPKPLQPAALFQTNNVLPAAGSVSVHTKYKTWTSVTEESDVAVGDAAPSRTAVHKAGEGLMWSEQMTGVRQSEKFQARTSRLEKEDEKSRPLFESVTDESGAVDSEEDKRQKFVQKTSVFQTCVSTESDSSLASEDEHLKHSSWHERVPPVGENVEEGDSLRFSPSGLEQKMMAELNKLESMEESLRQLLGIDRTNAVSLAQQETVSLAQILKAKQQAYEHDMEQLKRNVQKESVEAEKESVEAEKDRLRGVRRTASHSPGSISEMKKRAIRDTARAWKLDKGSANDEFTRTRSRERQSDNEFSATASSAVKKRSSSSHVDSSKTSELTRSASVKTADDSINDTDTESSIRTLSDNDVVDDSKAETVSEDIQVADYSQSANEESLTEDESFWQVLPSESHRKEVKKRRSDQNTAANDISGTQSVGDISSLFVGEDSFKKFTADMVRQFMHDDLMRTEHQAAVLRLREKALKEKTKAELAWINQQKQNLKKKGLDDAYPRILKQEKMIKKRQKEQEAEIHRLQEANKKANKERQLMLQQHELMTHKHISKQDIKPHVSAGRLTRPKEVHTEDEVSAFEDDIGDNSKESKSDSEVYKSSEHKAKGDKQKIVKQQKLRLDQKFLTVREHNLFDRRKNAEDLLAWKMRLDEEERNVIALEREAKKWNVKTPYPRSPERPPSRRGRPSREEKKVLADEMSEHIGESLTTTHVSKTQPASERVQCEGKKTETESNSDGSIPEEISSKSVESEDASTRPEKRMTITNEVTSAAVTVDVYENDTFEGDTSPSVSHKKSTVRRKLMPAGSSPLPSPFFHKAGSESESEDSISHTETLSDASDYEVRIRQLSDELLRRKKEVDILKRERKKKQKDKMKAHEEALKKQIEAYGLYIDKLKSEHADLEQDSDKSVVKPQIKQPKSLVKTSRISVDVSTTKSLHEQENGSSSGLDETHDGSDSNQTSPVFSDSREPKLSAVTDDTTSVKSSKLGHISEASESSKSKIPVQKSESKDSESCVTEIIDEASQDESIATETAHSQSLKINLSEPVSAELSKSEHVSEKVDEAESTVISTAAEKHKSEAERSKSEAEKNKSESEKSKSEAEKSKSESEKNKREAEKKSETEESKSVPETDLSEAVEESVSETVEASSKAPFIDLGKPSCELAERDEGESESESHDRVSRASSENNYSETFVEDELLSLESEKAPVTPTVQKAVVLTNDDISEHISSSLPSLSEKKSATHRAALLDKDLDDLLGEPVDEEENRALLLTDPLAEFSINDTVIVWGRKRGQLLYKGKVEFAPGIWAGVELDDAEGDMDGSTGGVQYFLCKAQHGILVPGSDITHIPEQEIKDEETFVYQDESDISATTDNELDKVIEGAAKNVELFDSEVVDSQKEGVQVKDEDKLTVEKTSNLNHIAENITNELTESLLSECFKTFEMINEKNAVKKVPPPVFPKPKMPKRDTTVAQTLKTDDVDKQETQICEVDEQEPQIREVDEQELHICEVDEQKSQICEVDEQKTQICEVNEERPEVDETDNQKVDEIKKADEVDAKKLKADNVANTVINNLMDDAISQMMEIRRKQRQQHVNKADVNDVAVTEDLVADTPIIRPVSPVPGSSPEHQQLEQVQLGKDLDGLLGIEDGEFFDDDLGFGHKPPPPYPGSFSEVNPMVSDEVFYAVPHERAEVDEIVANAVNIFWNKRCCGESLEHTKPSDSYFSSDDHEDGLASSSRRVYKQLLFNLTGEIIQDIYKDENQVDPPPWQKPKPKQAKYYKGLTPPGTVEVLKPVVQNAVNEILGTHKKDKTLNKWNIRKKKDHVDNILVQELRDEEANWVNYDEDEVAIKMQLTDTIFESLLSDTVSTINGIFQKRQQRPTAT